MSIKKQLRRLSETQRLDLDPSEVADRLLEESDRAFIILCGSLTEDRLRCAVIDRVVKGGGNPEKIRRSPTPTFGDLIDYADLLGLFTSRVKERVTMIKAIRNAAAHSLEPVSFDQQVIRDAALAVISPHAPSDPMSIRYAFGMRSQTSGFTAGDEERWELFLSKVLPA